MRKIFLTLAIIYSLIIATACPSKSSLEKAFNQSAKIGNLAKTSAITVGDLYKAKVIDLETKDKIVSKLEIVVTNGTRFHNVLSALAKQYKGNVDNLTAADKSRLDLIFSSEVIAPFADILTELGVLPEATAKQILLAIALLKTALLTVSNIFGRGSYSYKFYIREVNSYAV